MSITPRWVLGAAAVFGSSLAIAACGSGTGGSTGTAAASGASSGASSGAAASSTGSAAGSTASGSTGARTITSAEGAITVVSANPGNQQTLYVYSAQGYDHNTVAAFTKATGIPTQLVDDSTGPLLARIQAEKAAPQWGLLWVDGATAFAGLDQQGLLEKGLKVPSLTSAGMAAVPSDRSFIPTGLTMGCTVVYNTKALKTPPTTWQGLLAPSLKGKVGMNDPAVSGPTYPCVAGIMQMMGGVSQGESYLSKLKAAGLHVSQTNGDTLHLLTTGQIDVGLIQSSAAIGAALTTPGLKVAYLPDLTVLPGAIGVDAKAPKAEQAEAQKFIDYVLSPAGQHQMQIGDPTGDSLFWPTASGTPPLKELPPLRSVASQTINPYTWGAREGAINTWFTNHIAQ